MILIENVLFVMPKSRELQFPAMAALQSYVNDFQVKHAMNRVTAEEIEHRLKYNVEMAGEDWEFFKSIGIQLKQDREEIGWPDAVIELQDERLLSFYNSTKHCAQVCSAISGTEAPPLPNVRQLGVESALRSVFILEDTLTTDISSVQLEVCCGGYFIAHITGDEMLRVQSIGCVIGEQSWQTYMASAMGVPTIEILPASKSPNWLSKFKSPVYRLVEDRALDRIPDALKNLAELLSYRAARMR